MPEIPGQQPAEQEKFLKNEEPDDIRQEDMVEAGTESAPQPFPPLAEEDDSDEPTESRPAPQPFPPLAEDEKE